MLFGSANRDGAAFERAGRARPRARPEPVPVVRGGHPLLPRRAAGQARARRSPSRRSCGGRRGSSSSRRRAGSRRSSCAGSSRSASGSDGRRALRRARRLVHDRDVGRGRPTDGRTGWSRRSGRPSRGSSSWRTSGSTATPRPTSSGTSCRPSSGLRPEFVERPHRRQRRRPAASRSRRTRRTSSGSSTRSSARLPANRIVTVATPDYTVTPAGADYGDPRQQHDGIVAVNATMARARGRPGDRLRRHVRPVAPRRRRSVARRARRPAPERRPVRAVGRRGSRPSSRGSSAPEAARPAK